jgi:hypothetical protein
MCAVAWGLVTSLIAAVASVGLLIVAIIAALYAKGATISALEMLRLESEPVLMAAIETGLPPSGSYDNDQGTAARPDIRFEIRQHADGRIQFRLTQSELPIERTFFISIQNVGRSPALNVRIELHASPIENVFRGEHLPLDSITVPIFIQGLAPSGRFTILLHNGSQVVSQVNVLNATRSSSFNEDETVKVKLFRSSAMPFPI